MGVRLVTPVRQIPRTHCVKPMFSMPNRIPLKYDPNTRGGMAKIVAALRLEASPPLAPARIEQFLRQYLAGNGIDMGKLCLEDPFLLKFMKVRKEDGSQLNFDGLLRIMLGRIGEASAVLEEKR